MVRLRWLMFTVMLAAAPALFAQTVFTAVMSGTNEVPPTASTGWGFGEFILSADQDSLYYALVWKLDGVYTASHIHAAPAGVNGAVQHTLQNAGTAGAHGAWAIDAANLSRLLHDSLYVNAHTMTYPGGEVRGQILQVPVPVGYYAADMSGLQEVPPTSTTGWGLGTFILSTDGDSLYYALLWKLDGVYTASHIHAAPVGVNGAVQHTLLNAGSTGAHGAWAIDATNLGRLAHDSLYVNAHTQTWPGGEVRGQIFVVPPPPAVTDLVILPQLADDGPHLFWSPSPGATQYNVYISPTQETLFDPANLFITVPDTHYVHTGAFADPNIIRFYGVTAE